MPRHWPARDAAHQTPKVGSFCDSCGQPLVEPSAPDLRSYTPKHLAEKILTSRSALEGERKQVTVLFADVKGALHLQQELRRCADEMRLEHGLGFSVQMGLNPGEVVVGRIGDNLRMDYAAQGRSDRPPSRHLTSLSWKPDFATWKQYGSQLRAAKVLLVVSPMARREKASGPAYIPAPEGFEITVR